MFEALWPLLLFFCALTVAGRYRFKPEGWAAAWFFLFGLGGAWRLWAAIAPGSVGWLAFLSLLGCTLTLGWSSRAQWKKSCEQSQVNYAWVPVALIVAVVLVRGFFPQFDIDSLGYHLNAVDWLAHRGSLPAVQQSVFSQELRVLWIGLEEFLLFPGVLGDVPLSGGMLGGVLKALTLLSLASVLPRSWPLLRYGVLVLLGLDDQFIFSGQNTSVYVNPAFIGVLGLASWFGFRTWRGHSSSAWIWLGLTIGLVTVKFHGLFAALLMAPVLLGFFWKRGSQGLLGLLNMRRQRAVPVKWIALTVGLSCLAVFGVSLVLGGTPLFPFHIGPFQPTHAISGAATSFYFHGTFLDILQQHKYKVLTYCGSLSMKLVVVFLVPVVLGWLGRRFLFRLFPLLKKISVRAADYALLALLWSAGWAWIIFYFSPQDAQYEGRFPRLVSGVAALGILFFALSARKLVPVLRLKQGIQIALGLVWAVAWAGLLDRWVVNIPKQFRPSWSQVWNGVWHREARTFKLDSELGKTFLYVNSYKEPKAILECVREKGLSEEDFIAGRNYVVVEAMQWPTQLVGKYSFRVGGVFGGSQEVLDWSLASGDGALKYWLGPTLSWKKQFQPPEAHTPLLIEKIRTGKLLCQSEKLTLVELGK